MKRGMTAEEHTWKKDAPQRRVFTKPGDHTEIVHRSLHTRPGHTHQRLILRPGAYYKPTCSAKSNANEQIKGTRWTPIRAGHLTRHSSSSRGEKANNQQPGRQAQYSTVLNVPSHAVASSTRSWSHSNPLEAWRGAGPSCSGTPKGRNSRMRKSFFFPHLALAPCL